MPSCRNNHDQSRGDNIMKIEWIEGERLVPGIGLLQTWDIRDVPADIGKNLQRVVVNADELVPGQAVDGGADFLHIRISFGSCMSRVEKQAEKKD